MRKTNGRLRPVCGSHVRSAAVETLEICRMPFASPPRPPRATARSSSPPRWRGRRHERRARPRAARRRSSCRCGTPRAAASDRGRLPRGSRPRPRGARPAATAAGHRVAADGGEDGGDRQGSPRADPVGGEHDGVDPVHGHRGGPLAVPGAQARGGDEGQKKDDGQALCAIEGSVARPRGRPSEEAQLPSGRPAVVRGAATTVQPVPSGAASATFTSRRPARPSASSAACSASSGWLFFLERWARTTCRHASPSPFSRSRPTSPFEKCPSGPRMRSSHRGTARRGASRGRSWTRGGRRRSRGGPRRGPG